jgi:hypothetical protein
MRLAYLTLDEVNRDLARRLAAGAGLQLDELTPRGAGRDGHHGAALYDLDSLPADDRGRLLDALSSGWRDGPAAVHGYGLSGRQARALRRRGVLTTRRLSRGLFVRLRERAEALGVLFLRGGGPPPRLTGGSDSDHDIDRPFAYRGSP